MKLFLAPMEGITDWLMRDFLTKIGGIDHCVTEFQRVTTNVLPDHVFFKTAPELKNQSLTEAGVPVSFQLLGGDAQMVALNAERVCDLGALAVDLNFGCPAPTVNRHDGGATLLKNPIRLYNMISEVRKKIPNHIPVTAKVRLGFDHKEDHINIAKAVQDGGAHWLTVHARTKTDGYKPPAYWDYIHRMRESISIPVIANGEVWNVDDFMRIRSITGCEDVMIGRGAMANPFIFLEIKESLKQNQIVKIADWGNITKLLLDFYQLAHQCRGDRFAINRTKAWMRYLKLQFPEAEVFFNKIKVIENDFEFQAGLISERDHIVSKDL